MGIIKVRASSRAKAHTRVISKKLQRRHAMSRDARLTQLVMNRGHKVSLEVHMGNSGTRKHQLFDKQFHRARNLYTLNYGSPRKNMTRKYGK